MTTRSPHETTLSIEELETCACPLCGSQALGMGGYPFPPMAVRRCLDCGLWYLTPRLVEEAMRRRYLQSAYFTGGAESGYARNCTHYQAQEAALRQTFRRFLRIMAKADLVGGRLVEIGCGYGYFLDEAKPYFSSLSGTELNPDAATASRDLGHEVYTGGLETLAAGIARDKIISICVIEHIYSPIPFLQQLARSLAPGGWMIHATPLMDSFWLKIMGRRWPSFKIPEHVAFYDQAHLGELLRRAGAIEVRHLPYPHAFSLGSLAEKLGLALPKPLAERLVFLPSTMCAVAGRFS